LNMNPIINCAEGALLSFLPHKLTLHGYTRTLLSLAVTGVTQ
jgi:hypothetical protein